MANGLDNISSFIPKATTKYTKTKNKTNQIYRNNTGNFYRYMLY